MTLKRTRQAIDHALLLAALVAGKARWELFDGRTDMGEVCIRGMRWTVRLDEHGCPELHDLLRRDLKAAMRMEATT